MVNGSFFLRKAGFFFSGVILLSIFLAGCRKSEPTEPENSYPERANYLLALEVGSNVDSIFVVLVQADGDNTRKLSGPDKQLTWPLVSPDARLIAFRAGYDYRSLYVYEFATGSIRKILEQRNWDDYGWSPTSDKIAFTGDKTPAGFAVRFVDVNSGSVTQLTDTIPGNQRWPHWSPDGFTMAYTHYDSTSAGRYVYAYSFTQQRFTKLFTSVWQVAWSPDSRYVVLKDKLYSWPNLQLVADFKPISSGDITSAKWFPNGKELLLPSSIPDEGIYKLDITTSSSRKIISGSITPKAVTISKDGKLIAYIPAGSENYGFVVTDLEGGNGVSIALPIPGANCRRIQFLGDVTW